MKHWGPLFIATVVMFFATAIPGSAKAQNPLGTITATSITCPKGKTTGTNSCEQLAVSCPNTAGVNAYIKTTQPAGTPIGTIVFGSGGPGTEMYESFTDGMTVINGVLAAGYTVIQVSFGGPFNSKQPNGWLTGSSGPGAAACNYATPLYWISQNLVTPGTPLCATGNSDGAALIGYAMSHYGSSSQLAFAELTSGPPYSNEYTGCVQNAAPKTLTPCNEGMQGFWVGTQNAKAFIDPTYEPALGPLCSQGSKSNKTLFTEDSILSAPGTAQLSYPTTMVNFVLGGEDMSGVPNQANDYFMAITSPLKNLTCVSEAGHDMPNYPAGATQILNDLLASCHLQ